MALSPLDWLKAVRTIDRLLSLEQKHTALIEAQAKEIEALKLQFDTAWVHESEIPR